MTMAKKKYHFKAVITDKKGNVLSIGENNYTKSHPYMAKMAMMYDEPDKIFLHAEIAAILKCRRLTDAHTIHIYQIAKDGTVTLAKPCKICAGAISKAGIKVATHSSH